MGKAMDFDKLSIYLRGFQESDAQLINKWRNDRSMQALVSTPFRYVPEAIEREWVKNKALNNRTDIYLAICLREDGRMVGYLSINDIDYINRRAHGGGIVIDPDFQNGVIRFEAGILTRELVFDQLNLNRFDGKCLVEHLPSRISMEATGYKLEGRLRKAVYKDGVYHDQYLFSLLRDEYYEMMQNGEYTLKAYIKKVKELHKKYTTQDS